MRAIRFNPEKDLPPIPFSKRICELASDLKNLGLNWQPRVGCFVWDPDRLITAKSPFPGRIYFKLSLSRFMRFSAVLKTWLRKWCGFGIGRGSFLSMASSAFLLKGFKTLSRGHTPGIPKDDVLQMPGGFLIDTPGNIRYAHYSKDPSDNPSIATLLALKDVF